ncbi:hypothetical protein LFZ90_04575 [Salmonella enterica subsp. enterica serovar Blegdam]|nr:hypothetical protein LFZ90_04575 [Salmonella enterica subsp. enterica serovar Blegdam]
MLPSFFGVMSPKKRSKKRGASIGCAAILNDTAEYTHTYNELLLNCRRREVSATGRSRQTQHGEKLQLFYQNSLLIKGNNAF